LLKYDLHSLLYDPTNIHFVVRCSPI
jgi:hypothetical protein